MSQIRVSKQKRINLILVCFSFLILFFHNCGNVNISQRAQLDSLGQNGNGDNGSGTNPPPAPSPSKVTDLYFCEAYVVQSQLRYFVHPFNIANGNFSPKIETGNCFGHTFSDVNGDAKDEFIHNYTNSTVHNCKLEIYNPVGGQLLFSKNLPGTHTFDSGTKICNGMSWAVADQNNDGKKDIMYLYKNNYTGTNTQDRISIMDALTGTEITAMVAPHSNNANIVTQIPDVTNDGFEDFLGFVPGASYQNEVRDNKIAIYSGKNIWGMPHRTYDLPVHHTLFQVKLQKNKNAEDKYFISTIRNSVNTQGQYAGVEVSIGLYDKNLNKLHSFTKANQSVGNQTYVLLIESVGDFTGDGIDDLVAIQNISQYSFKGFILNGQNLSLITEFSGPWISQRLGRQVSDFFRIIGFAQADTTEAKELFLLVWEQNKIQVISINANNQITTDKTAPSEWLTEVFEAKSN